MTDQPENLHGSTAARWAPALGIQLGGGLVAGYLAYTGSIASGFAVFMLAAVIVLLSNLQLAGRLRSFLRRVLLVITIVFVVVSFGWVAARPLVMRFQQGQKIELVVMNWSGGGGQKEEQIVKDLVAEFMRQHPNIVVKRINPGDAGSYNTKLMTMMAAGTPPDVFYMGTERFTSFANEDLLMPLNQFIEADQAAGRETLALSDFFEATVQCFQFDGRTTGQGPLYGIPKDFTTWGMYYNKKLFDEAGIPYPDDEWTWAEFHDIAARLGQLPGVIGGAEITIWDDPIRAYLLSYGVDVVDDEFNSQVLEPKVFDLLLRLRHWRFSEEGTLVSGDSQVAQGQDTFVTGKVGMVGPLGRWVVPTYRAIEDFDWDFAPMPQGTQKANIVATVAWSMSSQTQHPEEAWELIKFLCGPEGQARAARLGLAIPSLREVAYSDAFIDPNQRPLNDRAYLKQAEYATVLRLPGYAEWKNRLSTRLDELLRSGTAGRDEDQADAAQRVLQALEQDWARDSRNPLLHGDYPPMPWGWIALLIFGPLCFVVGFVGWRWWRTRPGRTALYEEVWGYGLVSPWVIGFVAFMAFPIVLSLLLSLAKWNGVSTLGYAQWVGLENYRHLLFDQPRFWISLRVTAYYALLAVPVGQLLSLGAALLMNHEVKFSGFFRSAWYLPSVLAGVGIAILWRWVFDGEVGLMNSYLLEPALRGAEWITNGLLMGYEWTVHQFGGPAPRGHAVDLGEAPKWFTGDAQMFGPVAFAIMSFWAIGGTMVIYLAGLKGIPRELYEAAAIDGSSVWQRFRNITLPMLSPVIFFNVIMAVIASFQVFTQAFVMTGGGPGDATRFYVLYLYNTAFDDHHMGYASAMAWLLLGIILLLTLFAFRGSRRFVYYEALK